MIKTLLKVENKNKVKLLKVKIKYATIHCLRQLDPIYYHNIYEQAILDSETLYIFKYFLRSIKF